MDETTLITTEDAARMLHVAPKTLERWRAQAAGPPFVRLGKGVVRYDPDDLKEWLSKNKTTPEE